MTGSNWYRGKPRLSVPPWDIVVELERAPNADSVKALLIETASLFGFTSVFGGWVPTTKMRLEAHAVADKVLVSTMPTPWQARYFERDYVFRDPIVHRLQDDYMPFTWEEAYKVCTEPIDVRVIKGEASEFGLCTGFVVPISLIGGPQLAFSFGAPNFDAAPDALATLIFVTNITAAHLIAAPASARIEPQRTPITGRERDCLSWSAEGKTDWEIATILGISVPTVRKHLAAVRDKLQAMNKHHAVAIGIRAGLIK